MIMVKDIIFKCECENEEKYVLKLYSEFSKDIEITIKGCVECITKFAELHGKGLNLNNIKEI